MTLNEKVQAAQQKVEQLRKKRDDLDAEIDQAMLELAQLSQESFASTGGDKITARIKEANARRTAIKNPLQVQR